MKIKLFAAAMAVGFGIAGWTHAANATIIATDLGTAAPPATLGSWTMTPFPDDARSNFSDVTSVPSPEGGDIAFSIPLSLREIGSGWATWSHGYTGDVYWTSGATSVSITLPVGTMAFYFYAQPDPFSIFLISATAQDGTLLALDIDGSSGAKGFGFHTPDNTPVTTITVSSSVDFAIGEFGIAGIAQVPEPSTLAILGLGLAGLGFARRRRQA